jgi:hypothetical protein
MAIVDLFRYALGSTKPVVPLPPFHPNDSSILNIDDTKKDVLTSNMLAGDDTAK